jgi:HSP20 family molecular chaperone IbpA
MRPAAARAPYATTPALISEESEMPSLVYRSNPAAGTFLRRFSLPDSVRAERIEARYAAGVLEIAKQPRAEARRLPVTVN